MKRMLALLVVAVLLITASGEPLVTEKPSFSPKITAIIQDGFGLTPTEFLDAMMLTSDAQAMLMSLLLLDYVISGNTLMNTDEITDFDFAKPSYICRYGSYTIDAYFRLKNGQYLNLFYTPAEQLIYVFGITSTYNNNSSKTFTEVSGATLLSMSLEAANPRFCSHFPVTVSGSRIEPVFYPLVPVRQCDLIRLGIQQLIERLLQGLAYHSAQP